MLAAGLRGIEKGYELPPEADDNLFAPRPPARPGRGEGIESLLAASTTRWV